MMTARPSSSLHRHHHHTPTNSHLNVPFVCHQSGQQSSKMRRALLCLALCAAVGRAHKPQPWSQPWPLNTKKRSSSSLLNPRGGSSGSTPASAGIASKADIRIHVRSTEVAQKKMPPTGKLLSRGEAKKMMAKARKTTGKTTTGVKIARREVKPGTSATSATKGQKDALPLKKNLGALREKEHAADAVEKFRFVRASEKKSNKIAGMSVSSFRMPKTTPKDASPLKDARTVAPSKKGEDFRLNKVVEMASLMKKSKKPTGRRESEVDDDGTPECVDDCDFSSDAWCDSNCYNDCDSKFVAPPAQTHQVARLLTVFFYSCRRTMKVA